ARSVACGGPHHTDGPPHVIRLLFSASPAPAPTALPPPSLHDALPIWGGCSYRGGGGVRFFVGAPPRCEPGRQSFAPGAGAPTGSGGWVRFFCRSTASVRTGQAAIRTRGGCSYRGGGWVRFFVGAPPRCE